MEVPAGSGQIRQTEVPERVGREATEPRPLRHPSDHLGPGPARDRGRPVAARFGEEEGASPPDQGPALRKVAPEERPAGRRVGNDPPPSALRRLSPDPKEPVGRLQIGGVQPAELLAPKSRVVGEGDHAPVPDALLPCRSEKALPFLLRGNPRELLEPGDKTTVPPAAEGLSGRVAPPPHGIRLPNTLFHQGVEEEAHGGQALLQRGIREPGSRVQGHYPLSVRARPLPEICHIAGYLRARRLEGLDAKALATGQEVLDPTAVRSHRVRGETQKQLHLQPPPGQRLLRHRRVSLPRNAVRTLDRSQPSPCNGTFFPEPSNPLQRPSRRWQPSTPGIGGAQYSLGTACRTDSK